MNVLLVSTNTNTSPMPVIPAGLCMIAEAVERAGHRVTVVDLMFSNNRDAAMRKAVADFSPDLVGLSLRNIDNNVMKRPQEFVQDARDAVEILRRVTKVPIVLGGAAIGVMPLEILYTTRADVCVVGPGETAFPRLLDHFSRTGSMDGIPDVVGHDESASCDIAALNKAYNGLAPDYSRWLNCKAYQRCMATIPIRTKLGCPFSCVYCTYGAIEGRQHRLAEPEHVADAVSRFSRDGMRNIEFVDSVFNAPTDHAKRVCDALARTPHAAHLQSMDLSPRGLDDELLTLMERSGFVGIGLTVESASETVLRGLRKPFDVDDVHRAADVVRNHHIPCAWIFLLGGPGETHGTVAETLRFAERHVRKNDVAFFNAGIRIYPGTELEAIAREQGLLSLLPEQMLEPVFYVSPGISYERMEGMVKESVRLHPNFIDSDALELPLLPALYRISGMLGMRPPLWRHARHIRRAMQLFGRGV